MIRRRKKRIRRIYLHSCLCDDHVFIIRNLTYNKMEMTAEMMCQIYEGQLYKYTNVMKGWQFRWFILDPNTGILNYYLNEGESKQQPRGSVHLEAAVISPSDEDSNTFTVNSTSGESFKLRAQDARARQEWVKRLRAVAQLHAMAIAQNNPPLGVREHCVPSAATPKPMAVWDAFSAVREHLLRAEQSNLLLSRTIEDLPSSGGSGSPRHFDEDLLLLKAASQSMLVSLSQCMFILQQQANVECSLPKPTSKLHTDCTHSKKKTSSSTWFAKVGEHSESRGEL